jgi:hypothetical protein
LRVFRDRADGSTSNPDLLKVTIRGDHGLELQLAHDGDTRAVCERQVLVAIPEKQVGTAVGFRNLIATR